MTVNICESDNKNIYYNLAAEEWLMDRDLRGKLILFLFVNAPCIVLGTNQNIANECDLNFLKKNHILVSRRKSGGGCVYHDYGNLNYSFIGDKELISESEVYELIIFALKKLGINAKRAGRNDISACGRKISGNAFISDERIFFQHGTLLVESNLEMLDRSLKADSRKKKVYGIQSCKQRVINLNEINGTVTVSKVVQALKEAMYRRYGKTEEIYLSEDSFFLDLYEKYKSEDWIYGRAPGHTVCISEEYDWGSVQIILQISNRKIDNVAVETDSMDERINMSLGELLSGSKLTELNELEVENKQIKDIIASIAKNLSVLG